MLPKTLMEILRKWHDNVMFAFRILPFFTLTHNKLLVQLSFNLPSATLEFTSTAPAYRVRSIHQ